MTKAAIRPPLVIGPTRARILALRARNDPGGAMTKAAIRPPFVIWPVILSRSQNLEAVIVRFASLPFGAALLMVSARDSDNPGATPKKTETFWVSRYEGKVPSSATERAAEERAALERLLSILPDEDRKFYRESLESPDWNTQTQIVGVPGNPEAARLLSKIYALRQAAQDEADLTENRLAATRYSMDVTVALIPETSRGAYSGIVIRTHEGTGVIGLRASKLEPDLVAFLFRLLNDSRLRLGEFPVKDIRLYVKDTRIPPAGDRMAFASDIIARLRSAELRQVDRYGPVPAITVKIPPALPR